MSGGVLSFHRCGSVINSHFDKHNPCHKCLLICCDTHFIKIIRNEIIILILSTLSNFSRNLTSLNSSSSKFPSVTPVFFSII